MWTASSSVSAFQSSIHASVCFLNHHSLDYLQGGLVYNECRLLAWDCYKFFPLATKLSFLQLSNVSLLFLHILAFRIHSCKFLSLKLSVFFSPSRSSNQAGLTPHPSYPTATLLSPRRQKWPLWSESQFYRTLCEPAQAAQPPWILAFLSYLPKERVKTPVPLGLEKRLRSLKCSLRALFTLYLVLSLFQITAWWVSSLPRLKRPGRSYLLTAF